MNNFEDILNSALQELKAGTPRDQIVSKWPQYPQLSSLLEAADLLSGFPKAFIPKPSMQRKYVSAGLGSKNSNSQWHFGKFTGFVLAGVAGLTVTLGTVYTLASQSLPGDTLFSVKKTSERIQLSLATDPLKKANIEVKITQKRLTEAQQVFQNKKEDSSAKLAALQELSKQTSQTLKQVKTITTEESAPPSKEIISSLADIASKQTKLLDQINPETEPKELAANTLKLKDETASKIQEIDQIIAANSEQTLATLKANNSEEKTDAQETASSTPKEALQVKTEAKQASSSRNTIFVGSDIDEQEPQSSTETINPNTAVGGFILEDPQPQYKP